jgi:hypothetical protein
MLRTWGPVFRKLVLVLALLGATERGFDLTQFGGVMGRGCGMLLGRMRTVHLAKVTTNLLGSTRELRSHHARHNMVSVQLTERPNPFPPEAAVRCGVRTALP